MNRIRMWPHGALIILAFAVVGGIGAFLWQKYERRAEASSLPNAARIERVDGQAGINQAASDNTKASNNTNSQWTAASPNMPVTVGDRIYTKQNSRTQIGFTGRNLATLNANTSLDVLDLSQGRTQVALRDVSALFDVGSVSSGELFEVATPCGAVDFQQPGLYQIAINDDGNAVATVFRGEAQVVGQGGSGRIQKGEDLAVPCQGNGQGNGQGNAPAVMSKVEPNQAGYVIDNYYRSRYPKKYDGRYRNYYTYLDDPYYYDDPARLYPSYNYVNEYIPGIDDLDDYGDWQYISDYGYCWHPRVNTGWAPYESGYWTTDYPYGLTWVSNEPWGYAPYHYGRWAYASDEWFWVPGSVSAYPTYSPALTAFFSFGNSGVGWVALGPSDPYQVTYYDPYWQPAYTYPSNVLVERLVNINVPGAVTVVPTNDFGRVIDPTIITRVDPQTIAGARPVLNPLAVDPLRAAAFQARNARQRIDVPRQIEQQIANTPVVASTSPAPRFNRDLARTLHVEPVAAQARRQNLQISDQRAAAPGQATQQSNIAAEQARERQMAELARQAAHGDRNARQQMQQLRRQQVNPGALPGAGVQAQGQAVGQPARPQDQRQLQRQQREAERQQTIQSQQQQRAAAQPQVQAEREQRRQNQIQQAQTRHSQQQQMLRSQPQPRPQMARPQPQAQPRPQMMRPQPQPRPQAQPRPQMMRPQPQPRPQAEPRPQMVRPQPQAQPRQQMVRPPQAEPRPQAQPQARPQPQQRQQGPPPAQQKAPGKKHP